MRVEVSTCCLGECFVDEGLVRRAVYLDGQLTPPKPGQTADPKPTAGNDGTTITVSFPDSEPLVPYSRVL